MDKKADEKLYEQLTQKAETFVENGQFLEAFLIQSCLVEGVIKLCAEIHFSACQSDDQKFSKNILRWPISKLLELLWVTGIIERDFHEKLQTYTQQRNRVVHQLLAYDVAERDAALEKAYGSGKEMQQLIGDLIRGKLETTVQQLEKTFREIEESIAEQKGITVEELKERCEVIIRPKGNNKT